MDDHPDVGGDESRSRDPQRIRLTPQSKSRLHKVLVDGFNREEFTLVTRFGLGQEPDRLVRNGPLDTQMLDVIKWAERRGRVDNLLEAARQQSPSNRDLRNIELIFEPPPREDPLGWTRRRVVEWYTLPRFVSLVVVSVGFVASAVGIVQYLDDPNRPPEVSTLPVLSARAGEAIIINLISGVTDDGGVAALDVRADTTSSNGGTIALTPDGHSVEYAAPKGFVGRDEFDYVVTDGDGASTGGTQSVNVRQGRIEGQPAVAVAPLAADSPAAEDLVAGASQRVSAQVAAAFDRSSLADGYGLADTDAIGEPTVDAMALSEEIGADLVVYGTLSADGSGSTLDLRFYLSPEELTNAREISGDYPLATIESDAGGSLALFDAVDRRLPRGLDAVIGLLDGVNLFNQNLFTEAESRLLEAANDWPISRDSANGIETVWMLLGNVRLEQGDLAEARAYYETALDSADDDVRPRFGIAEVSFLEARGDRCNGEGTADLAALDEARRIFEDLATVDEPEPFIAPRAQVESGRIALCVYLTTGRSLDEATDAFTSVIEHYGDNSSLREVVAEAHQRLALVREIEGQPRDAADEYLEAIRLLRGDDAKEAEWHYQLARIYLCDIQDLANAAYHYGESEHLKGEQRPQHNCEEEPQ